MSQNIINPDRRDPSRIRNKADIGLSRVDNIGVSDILDLTKDFTKDEVCRGDRYAEAELMEGISFEIPLCEFTENSTKLSIVVSFLKNDDIFSTITANLYHTYDTSIEEPFKIEFDLVGSLVQSPGNYVSFYLYEGNNQTMFSMRCNGTVLKNSYGITAVSYYFSDYIVVSNNKEEHLGFRKLTADAILTGTGIGNLINSGNRIEYIPSLSDRNNSSFAKSLSVYDSSGNLIYNDSLKLTQNQSSNYSFPTINTVPFTGSKDIDINENSTRNITIFAQHSGPSSDEAGVHKWEVLEDTRVVANNNNTTNGTSVFSKKSKDAEKEGYGLCRMVGEKLYQKSNTSNSLGELQNITNSLNTLKGYNDSSVSFGLLQKYLTSICTILTDIIGSSGNVSIEFGESLEENNIKNPYTYFGISPTIDKIIRVHYKLICPEKCLVKGIINRPSIYNDYLITVNKIEGDDLDCPPEIINSDSEYGVIFYDGLDKTEISGDGKAIKTGVIEFTTARFPSFESNLSWGEENYLNVSYRTEKESSNEIPLLTIPIHLKSLNVNNIFYSNSSATSVFNPIILTRIGRYSYTETTGATELTSLDYSENFLANGCEGDYESSHCLWKNNSVDIDNIQNAQKSITKYGIILPPKQFIERYNNDGIKYSDYLLVEGYSLSRYIKLEIICPEKDKTLGNFFEDFNILIKGTSGKDLYGVLRGSGTNGSERARFQKSSHYVFNFELPISLDVEKSKRSQNITSSDNNSKTIVNTVFSGKEYSSLDSRLEDHSYSQLTPEDIIKQDTGFSSEEDLHSNYRFYLLLYPKNSTHRSSYFDILDLQKNPYIKITACSSSDFTEVFGNEINVNFSQNRFPLVLENVNTSYSENTYGVYSSLRFMADGNNPHGLAYFYEDYNNIGVEELKIPVTFYKGSGYNNEDKIYSNENDKEYSDLVGSKNFELLTGLSGGTVSSRISTEGDNLSIYGNYIKIKSNSIKYSHSGQIDPNSGLRPTEYSHYNFIRNFKLTNEDIKRIYDSINRDIWVGGSSRNSYPKEFLPDFNKITNIEYPLSFANPNILGVGSSTPARRKTIIFSLQRMAISNYSPMLGGIGVECPSQFMHYRRNDSEDYTSYNEKFPENLMGTGRYYKVDCNKRTWGATKINNIEESDVILRLSNLMVNFGFAFNIAGNFSGNVVILGKLKVTAPKINTEANSDYDKFCKFDEKYKSSFSFYGAANKKTYKEDLKRLKKYVSDAFKEEDSYSWEMYTTTEIYLNNTWKSSQSYMGSDLTSDDYGEITKARKYDELNEKTKRLIFYPQNQKDLKKETDPWKRAASTKYSVLNLNVNCRYDDPDTNLTAEYSENFNPHSDGSFHQSSALFPDNEIWDDLVNIYPRMTTMRPVTEPTTLELTLEFYYQNAGEKIPIDVNNGIDNNKLTFKFDLWPEGHSGNMNRNYYGVIVN